MMRKRMFRKGKALNVFEVLREIEMDHWVYMYDRPKHPAVIKCMMAGTLIYLCRCKIFRKAIRKEDTLCSAMIHV